LGLSVPLQALLGFSQSVMTASKKSIFNIISLFHRFKKFMQIGVFSHALLVISNSFCSCRVLQNVTSIFFNSISCQNEKEEK
jgi:hypothetical protein